MSAAKELNLQIENEEIVYISISNDIKVSVETFYKGKAEYQTGEYNIFSYRISIENNGDNTVQLLKRHWLIFDGNGQYSEVKGDGIVGQQPILEPGQKHQYVSGCNFASDFGRMEGWYTMQRLSDGHIFEVEIPEFLMVVPAVLN